jgi:rhodanese-related sulfurtransferase
MRAMLKRLLNLPFSVASRAARAYQEREDARAREKYGSVDPGVVPVGSADDRLATSTPIDPGAFRMAAHDAVAQVGARPIAFVDVRATRAEAIPGSIHMPLAEANIRVSELPTDKLVLVYCDDGRDSAKAVAFFREREMDETFWVEGGLKAWKAAGGPVERAR